MTQMRSWAEMLTWIEQRLVAAMSRCSIQVSISAQLRVCVTGPSSPNGQNSMARCRTRPVDSTT